MAGCQSHGSRLRETQIETATERARDKRSWIYGGSPYGFGMGHGKLREGLGVRVGQSILRAGKPPYIEVEGFPFGPQLWAGCLPPDRD